MPTVRRTPTFARLALGLSAGLLACTAQTALAQDFDSVRLGGAPREGGRVGAVVFSSPAYKGSDERKAALLPVVEYRWANGFFAGVGSGVGYEFLRGEGTVAGVRLTPDMGRKESRADALKGMGDIGAKPEIGLYLNHAFAPFGVGVSTNVRYGAGGNGLLADVGVGWGMPLAPTVRLRLGAAATLANSAYMQKFFGVTAEQSATSGYAVTEARAGVRDTRLSVGVLWAISPKLAMTGGLTATQLASDAANSPLTRQRSGFSAASTLTYAF